MKNTRAQSTIEFTFAMIAVMFLIYGMVMVFRWAGMDLANRRVSEDGALTTPVLSRDRYPSSNSSNAPGGPGDPSVQLNADLGGSFLPMAAVYHGRITDGNTSQ